MQLSYIGRRVNTLFLHAPIAFVGAVGVLLLLVAGVMWVPGLAEAQEDAEYVWAFDDFGRMVVHWDHEAVSGLRDGDVARYTVRWRQRGTVTWNTIIQYPVVPDDPDVLIDTDLLIPEVIYEITLRATFEDGVEVLLPSGGVLEAEVGFTTARQSTNLGDALYAASDVTDSLYTWDTSSGDTSLVGSLDNSGVPRSLAWCNGAMYLGDGSTRALYTVDLATGVATRVHATNGLAQSTEQLEHLLCHESTLYVIYRETAQPTSRYIAEVNTTNGGRSNTRSVNLRYTARLLDGITSHDGVVYTHMRPYSGSGTYRYATYFGTMTIDDTSATMTLERFVAGTRPAANRYGHMSSDGDSIVYTVWNTSYSSSNQYGALQTITDIASSPSRSGVGDTNTSLTFYDAKIAFVPDLTVPGTPENVVITVVGTVVNLSWDAVSDATGYKVQWSTTSGSYSSSLEQTTAGTMSMIEGLNTSTTYYFHVVATREGAASDSIPSTEQTVTIGAALPPPGQVTGLRLSVLGNSITADWDSASNADAYKVQWRGSSGTFGTTNQIITSSRSVMIDGLAENTPFQVRVIATRSGALDGTPSSVVSATTEEIITSPSQVGGVDAYPMGDSTGASVYVEWDDVAEADEYKVQWGTNRGTVDSTNQVSVSTNNAIISSSIANNTTYYIRVIATRNGADDGRASAEVSVRTTLPSGLTISAYTESNNRATMRWSDSQSYNIAASGDEGWFIRCAAADDEFDLVQRLSANEDLRSISTSAIGFQPGGAMKCQVQVRDTDGDPVSLWSASATRTFPHATIITTAIYSDGSRTVELEWTGEDRAYWHYAVSFDSTPRYTRTLTDTDDARSETLSNVYVPPGQTMYVWVYGSTNSSPSLTNSSYLAWSGAHAISGSDVGGCDAAHVQDVGELTGTERSESGRWDGGACLMDDFDYSDDEYHDDFTDYSLTTARFYSFSVRSSRAVTVTLNYVTEHTTAMAIVSTSSDERHAWGGYVLRIRQATFDGTLVETKDDTYKQGTRRLRQDPSIELNAAGGQVYVVEVMQYGIGGGRDFSMDVMFSFIPEATPTPFPTQTPVPRINVDFRLHPNPGFINYEAGQVYGFTMEGDSGKLPAVVRAGNSPVLAVGKVDTIACDIDSPAADDAALFNSMDEKVYVRICMDNNNSSLEIISEADGQFLASYTLYVAGDVLATPGPVDSSIGVGEDTSGQDHVGITIFVGAICEAAGMRCDIGLIKTGFTIILALAGAVMPIIYTKGRASTGSVGLSVVFFLFGLILGALLVGFALWIVGVVLFAVFLLAGLAIYGRMSALRT